MAEAAVARPGAQDLEIDDMQGLVGRAYGHLPFAYYALCRVGDAPAARHWLGRVAGELFTAGMSKNDDPALNLAMTFAGLRAFGLSGDALATFPRPLEEGMVTEHRSRILGDFGDSDPAGWRWGGPVTAGDIHVLVMIYARTSEELEQAYARRREEWAATGALEEVTEPLFGCLMDGTEHFGFADGLSQPMIKGWPTRTGSVHPPAPPVPARFADVEPGEILLGYKDNYGRAAAGPTVADDRRARLLPRSAWSPRRRDFGRNGSFLVFRQLAQDVPAFRRFVASASEASAARGTPLSPEHVGAKMVGRWASGASIVAFPDADPGKVSINDFGYHDDDQRGLACCPMGAHVRRANPRDSGEDPDKALMSTLNHRVLRRGRPYGLQIIDGSTEAGHQPDAERGLLFICLNSDFERQFEFVQHTWLNNATFAGLYDEVDPVTGPQPESGGRFTVPDQPVRRRFAGVPGLVTTRGGAYFFLPGIKAVRYLAATSQDG